MYHRSAEIEQFLKNLKLPELNYLVFLDQAIFHFHNFLYFYPFPLKLTISLAATWLLSM